MKRECLLFISFLLFSSLAFSQVKVGDNITTINPASLLELESTDQGVLLPRLTSLQRDAQASWTEGHVIYNTTDSCFQFFDGNAWDCLVGASTPASDPSSSLPFTVIATSADCRISDYIAEGVPDTLIKEDRIQVIASPLNQEYWYNFGTLAAAMNNHSIIGLQTDTRVAFSSGVARTVVRYALPDANNHIGKTFLLYSIPDSFFPLTGGGGALALEHFFNGVIPVVGTVDRPEDWANDFMSYNSSFGNSVTYRNKIYQPTQVSGTGWQGGMNTFGNSNIADVGILHAPFVIITSIGPDDWSLNCNGMLSYKNPLAP